MTCFNGLPGIVARVVASLVCMSGRCMFAADVSFPPLVASVPFLFQVVPQPEAASHCGRGLTSSANAFTGVCVVATRAAEKQKQIGMLLSFGRHQVAVSDPRLHKDMRICT